MTRDEARDEAIQCFIHAEEAGKLPDISTLKNSFSVTWMEGYERKVCTFPYLD